MNSALFNKYITPLFWLFILGLILFALPITKANAAKNIKPLCRIHYIGTVTELDIKTQTQNQVLLIGEDSWDKDGSIKSWKWEQTGGVAVEMTSKDSANASFTTPAAKKSTKLTFTLTVKDNLDAICKVKTTVTVKPTNNPPTVDAGEDKTVEINKLVTLNGSASDNDGTIKSWQWTQISGPKVSLFAAKTDTLAFTSPKKLPKNAISADLKFQLTVTDDEKAKATDSVIVKVQTTPVVTPDKVSMALVAQSFNDGDVLPQGATETLTWTVKNTSNIDLPNVQLSPGNAVGSINVGNISPNSLSNWAKGETQTFSVTVTAPTGVTAGNNSHSWALTYNGKAIPFADGSNNIKFNLATQPYVAPSVSLHLDNKNFTDNEVLTSGSAKILTWTVTNTSNIDLTNITLTPSNATGGLTVDTISPSTVTNWGKGQAITFSATVTATPTTPAGSNSQSWSLAYAGKSLALDNGSTELAFSLITLPPAKISLNLDGKNFNDNELLTLNSSKILTWTVTNTSDIDLSNVIIRPDSATGILGISSITPSTIATWSKGQSVTFSTTVTAPAIAPSGTHTGGWHLTYGNGTPLPFNNINSGIKFSLVTQSADNAATLSVIDKNFADNEVIARGSSKVITWTAKNTGNVDLANIAINPGTATGGLTIDSISPSTISSWPQNGTVAFSVNVTAPENVIAGTNSQSWSATYDNGKPAPFTGQPLSLSLKTEAAKVEVSLDNKDFTDNTALGRDSSTGLITKTLHWTVKNASDITLTNVVLNPTLATDNVTATTINPVTISSWNKGDSKTFAVTVTAPADVIAGTHSQNWALSYDGGKAVPFSTGQSLGYVLQTTDPTVSANVTGKFINGVVFNNGINLRETNGTISKTLSWTVVNNSNIPLTNVVLTPGTATGALTIGTITPSSIANWAMGTSQTFQVSVTAPATIPAGTQSQNWTMNYNNGKPVPLTGQTLGFALSVLALGECPAPSAQPASLANAVVLSNFIKISATGFKLKSTSQNWSCVLDNSSGLMWEMKTDDNGLHDKDWLYTWYQPNGVVVGTPNGGECGKQGINCDTASFVQAINTEKLCGYQDWRMPSDDELLSIVSKDQVDPAIKEGFFPYTQQSMYWSASETDDGKSAWYVSFGRGFHAWNLKSSPRYVRLVRGNLN